MKLNDRIAAIEADSLLRSKMEGSFRVYIKQHRQRPAGSKVPYAAIDRACTNALQRLGLFAALWFSYAAAEAVFVLHTSPMPVEVQLLATAPQRTSS
ncbi:hypothetical protein [Pseudogemmobacter bohemicus]|uniref:hypothetical protein n=1 Tax=Pseudogemmobacter bohemicus TaxID=2250708 RepID=UPI000DD3FAB1|nr:hypothetical protein [Pseudogemmobacter bohemicus]